MRVLPPSIRPFLKDVTVVPLILAVAVALGLGVKTISHSVTKPDVQISRAQRSSPIETKLKMVDFEAWNDSKLQYHRPHKSHGSTFSLFEPLSSDFWDARRLVHRHPELYTRSGGDMVVPSEKIAKPE